MFGRSTRTLVGPTTSSPDLFVRHLCADRPNMLVPHILMASYAYYVLDRPVLMDDTFDWMTRKALAEWEGLAHPHKHLITPEDLKAGTGYAFEYPEVVKGAAKAFAERFSSRKKPKKRKPKV